MTARHTPYWLRIPDMLIGTGAVESNIVSTSSNSAEIRFLSSLTQGLLKQVWLIR